MLYEDGGAKSARLVAYAEAELTRLARRDQTRDWAHERIASITGFCSTEDGSVSATVDSKGVLVRLELTSAARQVSESALASVITATVQQAVADMRNQVREVLSSVRNEGIAVKVPPWEPVNPVTLQGVTPVPPRHEVRDEEEPEHWWARKAW